MDCRPFPLGIFIPQLGDFFLDLLNPSSREDGHFFLDLAGPDMDSQRGLTFSDRDAAALVAL